MTNLHPPTPGPVSQQFGNISPTSPGGHKGQDRPNPVGTPVHPVAYGRVIKIVLNDPTYGNYVIVKHRSKLKRRNGKLRRVARTSKYAHLSDVLAKLDKRYRHRDLIGRTGNTGLSTGPHLHWEAREDGIRVDPREWIGTK